MQLSTQYFTIVVVVKLAQLAALIKEKEKIRTWSVDLKRERCVAERGAETCECVRKRAISPRNDSRGSAVKIAPALGRSPRPRTASPADRDAATDRGILISGAERTRRRYNPTCV